MRPCNRTILKALDITHDMLKIADEGDANGEDTGCGVLYGVVRDAAYKIRQLAENEKAAHERKGWWKEDT